MTKQEQSLREAIRHAQTQRGYPPVCYRSRWLSVDQNPDRDTSSYPPSHWPTLAAAARKWGLDGLRMSTNGADTRIQAYFPHYIVSFHGFGQRVPPKPNAE